MDIRALHDSVSKGIEAPAPDCVGATAHRLRLDAASVAGAESPIWPWDLKLRGRPADARPLSPSTVIARVYGFSPASRHPLRTSAVPRTLSTRQMI